MREGECGSSAQSMRGGDLDEWSFDLPKGEALRLGRLPVSKKRLIIALS